MNEKKQISPKEHNKQIDRYAKVRSRYKIYAATLRRVFEEACAVANPAAFVQARAKAISSFAEKCARKYEQYPNPVEQFTDLCGARIIVQTLEQVEAAKQFIRANFKICEEDEKGLLLADDRFGYRDMHFIVQLRADRCAQLGISKKERKAIGAFKAEVQVRTWLQHAWADTLHDRIYKTPLKPSSGIKRTGNLLAALMEEGDRNYNQMVHEIDGMLANYTAIATKEVVQDEIRVQRLVLANEREEANRPGLALKLARLLLACGDHAGVVAALDPYKSVGDANRCELLQTLGYSLCRTHAGVPSSAGFKRGMEFLYESLKLCGSGEMQYVPDIRKGEGLHARALARLALLTEALPRKEHDASAYWQKAHEHEPDNPYYLAGMLGFEAFVDRSIDSAGVMRTTIQRAIQICRAHAEQGTELPFAYFTAGRLSLLLNEPCDAIGYYALAIRHCVNGRHCIPADTMEAEKDWISRLFILKNPPPVFQWVLDLFELAEKTADAAAQEKPALPKALILAGGAASLDAKAVAGIRPLVKAALAPFRGTVISGGTVSGLPGCVGAVTGELAARKAKGYRLIGYIPHKLPKDALQDRSYELRECGESEFSAEQIIRCWRDLLDEGVLPGQVLCLGFGGGPVALVEYFIAMALGATVAVIPLKTSPAKERDAAARLASDPLWQRSPDLFSLPPDVTTVRALLVQPDRKFKEETIERMAMAFHENYVDENAGKLPRNMKPWERLDETYQLANKEQARYAVEILRSCGFKVRDAANPKKPAIFDGERFSAKDVERMAEMEHGRWNAERLRDGWRYGPEKDEKHRIHPCLVPWTELSDGESGVKKFDRSAVRKFPEILAKAGLEVVRA